MIGSKLLCKYLEYVTIEDAYNYLLKIGIRIFCIFFIAYGTHLFLFSMPAFEEGATYLKILQLVIVFITFIAYTTLAIIFLIYVAEELSVKWDKIKHKRLIKCEPKTGDDNEHN